MNICWDNEQESDCSGGKQITTLSPYITAIPNGNGKAGLSKAKIEGDSMSGKQLWLERLSFLKFEKSCQKSSDRNWWKHIWYNGWYCRSNPNPNLPGKRPPMFYFFLQVTLFQPVLQWHCVIVTGSLWSETLSWRQPELLSGKAAADHATIIHSMPYDFTTVLTVYLKWTEPHFFLRLNMNPRDVENKCTWNTTSLGPEFLSKNNFIKALKHLESGLVSCLWMQHCT